MNQQRKCKHIWHVYYIVMMLIQVYKIIFSNHKLPISHALFLDRFMLNIPLNYFLLKKRGAAKC